MTCPKFLLRYYTLKRSMLVWLNKHLLGTMLTVVVISFVANFCLIFTGYSKEARGTFGDQFGAVNALFSGLAFAGLIYMHDLLIDPGLAILNATVLVEDVTDARS